MKRGFLVSPEKPAPVQGARKTARPEPPKKSEEELERERDAVIMSRLTIDQAIEYEALRSDLATEKQTARAPSTIPQPMSSLTLRNYEIREERNKQALDCLSRPDAESKVWYCAGDFFIHLPKPKAEKLVQRDRDNAACEVEATHERIKSKALELQQLAK